MSADDEDELVGRVFLYTPSRTSHGPWPCIVLHSFSGGSTATTPGLEMPPEVRRAFEASKLEDKCLVLYFPIPDPNSGKQTEWAVASARRLIAFDSDEGRASRAASVSALLARGASRKSLARFVAALDEARVTWQADGASDEVVTWLQCSACAKWRRGVCGLDAGVLARTAFVCSMNTWRPAQAACSAPQEDKEEEEDWEGGEEEEAEAGGGGGGGGGGRGGSSGDGAETEPEEEEGMSMGQGSGGAARGSGSGGGSSAVGSGSGFGGGSSVSGGGSSSRASAAAAATYLDDTEPED